MEEIRKANENDVKLVMEIINDAKELFKSQGSPQWQEDDGYPNEETIQNDLKHQQLYVFTLDQYIVGIAAISSIPDECYRKIQEGDWLSSIDEKYLVIHRVAVRKNYYGRQIAYKLIEYSKELAKNSDIHSIRADTMDINVGMNKLLQKCGFKSCGIIYLDRKMKFPKRTAYEYLL